MTRLTSGELLELSRWNTPTIYNGWEQITRCDAGHDCFNLEECRDFMPHMGPMVGYAVTLVIQPGNPEHRRSDPQAWSKYRREIANQPGPKIIVVQDLDKPACYGSFWGEVTSNYHRSMGCVGTITDGAIRDLDEMNNAGFKAIARRMCVGHAYSQPVRWNCEVEVFGRKVMPGQLIHADKHGFLVIPEEDEKRLLEAAQFMDSIECNTVINVSRSTHNKTIEQVLSEMDDASKKMRVAVKTEFGKKGEF